VAATETQTVKATAKFVRVSPRKARLVADNIRGRSVPGRSSRSPSAPPPSTSRRR
jgi:hypothetical protein